MALRRRFSSIAIAVVSFAGIGCARAPQVQVESLALKRVVVYRNGVGYFERGGHVEGSEVRFKMKESEVGDFLATLAVMEQGSSVRAAASPLDIDDEVNKDENEDKDIKKTSADGGRKARVEEGGPRARREGARHRGRVHRVGAGVAPIVPARRARKRGGGSAGLGDRREPLRRGLEGRAALARGRSAALVPGAARGGGDSGAAGGHRPRGGDRGRSRRGDVARPGGARARRCLFQTGSAGRAQYRRRQATSTSKTRRRSVRRGGEGDRRGRSRYEAGRGQVPNRLLAPH